jgi:hypothetical protein
VRYGEVVRLSFRTDDIVLFDGRSDRSLRTDRAIRGAHG